MRLISRNKLRHIMKKLIYLITAISTIGSLTGCATGKNQDVYVVDGSRADGIVDVGFHYQGWPLCGNPIEAKWTNAPALATSACQQWGYSRAQVMNNMIYNNGYKNQYGCMVNGRFWVRFICNK